MKLVRIFYFTLFAFYQSGCINITGECNNQIFQRLKSPNQKFQMVKFEHSCGATVGNSIQVSIISISDSLPNSKGNIFIADAYGAWDETDTSVIPIWIDNENIELRFEKTLTIFHQDSVFNGINIKYVPK